MSAVAARRRRRTALPQGTVLGPLLFLLHVNDITGNISSEIRLFADECILYRQIKTPGNCTSLQQDITRLYNWSLTWQMVFNTKKCHILSIPRKRDRPTITYTLGTEKLSVVESYPYLGVTVSSDFRWHHHINTISSKATRTLNFIRRNIYGCSPEAKALAHTSLVRPHLEYASAVWDPYTARDSNKLDKVQRRAPCFVRRDYRRATSASQLISELGWQSLAERWKTSCLTLLYKAINGLVAIPMDELEHTSRCTRHCGPDAFIILQSCVDAYKFSFFPRTVSDWNFLPSSARSTPSVNSFKTVLHRDPSIWRHQ